MKLKKSKILIVLALILTLTIGNTAFASPNQGSSSSVQAQIDNIEANIEEMDEHIMTLMEEINNTKDKIAKKKVEISNIEKEIENANKGIKDEEDLYKQRMRVLYMDGMFDSYLHVLVSSTSFSDFISRLQTVVTVMQFDSKLIEGLKDKKKEISLKKEALVSENNQLLTLQQSDKDKLDSIEKKKDKQKELLAELNRKKNETKTSTSNALVYQTYNEVTGSLPSRGSGSIASNNDVVAFAMKYLGTPYVWGGTTPEGFDCSGFTQFVYRNFGVTLNRISRDQATQGIAVSRDSLQAGDLIFYGSPVYHVGIYAGNGMMVHAPYTGEVVKIAAVRWQSVSALRRVR